MGDPLRPIFDNAVPWDLSPTLRKFDVVVVFDVTEKRRCFVRGRGELKP